MGKGRRLVSAVLLAILPLAACATTTSQSGASGPAPSASVSGSAYAPSPSGSPGAFDSPVPSGSPVGGSNPSEGGTVGPEVTIQGTVTAGVEIGCYILRSDDGGFSYLLLGGDRNTIMAGGRVQVTGRPAPNMMSYCQQGTPFTVTAVRRI
jgi:hypothetical protein